MVVVTHNHTFPHFLQSLHHELLDPGPKILFSSTRICYNRYTGNNANTANVERMSCKDGKKKQAYVSTLLVMTMTITQFVKGSDDDGGSTPNGLLLASPNLQAKSLILVKVYCLLIVFWATFFAGVSPYFFRWNSTFLVLGSQYAGGVFLGTAFIHFLSDSHTGFQKLTTSKHYAFAQLLAISGYLITMLGDLIIQRIMSQRAAPPTPPTPVEKEGKLCKCADEEVPDHEVKVHPTSFADALILILALCFHSVFEGIAIGVAETNQDAWKTLWTISIHKVFAATAMGVALLRMLPNRPLLSCFSYAAVFAISTPVGVAIGIIIDATAQGAIADWIYVVSMGLASGVFVYVAINHLLAKGFFSPSKTSLDEPLQRVTAVTLGAATIAVVMIWDT